MVHRTERFDSARVPPGPSTSPGRALRTWMKSFRSTYTLPTVLPRIKDAYWPHIVNEDFMLSFFVDLDLLLEEISAVRKHNLLCVYRNPPRPPAPCKGPVAFEFLGYDLVDVEASASALTNCGGFPDVFKNEELSSKGLLTSHARAVEVQAGCARGTPRSIMRTAMFGQFRGPLRADSPIERTHARARAHK